MSPRRSPPFSTDLSGVLLRNNVTGSDLSNISLLLLNTTSLSYFDDSDAYESKGNSYSSYNCDYETARTPEDIITGQLISLSSRTTRATRELENSGSTMPLRVNSPVVNEAFEAANALVQIINSTLLQRLAHEGNERQRLTNHGSVFSSSSFPPARPRSVRSNLRFHTAVTRLH